MVLEEASAQEPSSAFSEEGVPSSDLDPYASSNTYSNYDSTQVLVTPPGTEPPVYVNLNNLPKPFGILFTQQDVALAKGIRDQCRLASTVLQRPLRQEEADAFSFWMARSLRIGSYGAPIGLGIATVQAYRGIASYRFPGWTPFKPAAAGEDGGIGMRSPDRFGPLRGQMARTAWQGTRLCAYWIVGAMLGSVFAGSYALSVGMAGRARDPRLSEFMEALRRRASEGRGRLREEIQQQQAQMEGPREGETVEMARQRREVAGPWRNRNKGQRQTSRMSQKADADNMSPTAGAFEDEFMGQSAGEIVAVDNGQTRQQQINSSDVISTATNQQQQRSSSPNQQTRGSWDRIRQGAMSGNSQSASRSSQTRGRNAGEDSFAYSQGEEDRQLARGEAQKEFDNRVEREKEGRDFEEGSRQTGWRR